MMGGEIDVESETGRGSTFTVRLPANTDASADALGVSPAAESDSSREVASRVLVIDDDAGVRDLLARMLAKEGFHVATASSGEQGVRRAREFQPTVITLDVMMPGMDGWTVLAALKNDSECAHIPVVMVSLLDHSRVGYALGAAAYMTKPIDRRRLIDTLTALQVDAPFHVLLVEDEPTVREVVRRTLVGDGWSVTEAQNGREALDALTHSPKPAAILLDLMMPEMDGFQFIAELDAEEAWRDIPVVVITAMDLTGEQREQLGRRVDRILEKGAYSRDELIELVRAKVGQHILRAATPSEEDSQDTRVVV
jgi:CheY-like chemotaxis protein